ncbi:class I adenylate-forming enzyme family protein [Fontisphaera persica]|uniref:class I adenylate-forming enzyme family protein n=1 Tax=Fontisphaera persica TaxID=2974023 RepID=UPI0024BF359D|nr:class I adenylate-forming enzyme family protein [Fontisphaera persica]WCJ59853.1 class I adenylate-forming enzyme family protein [Fontisphaera persica]
MSATRQLYELWRHTASHHADSLALWDVPGGRRWTFAQLARDSETPPPAADHGICHPRGNGADFILELLRGWRHGLVTCPLDRDLGLAFAGPLPAQCAHLKVTSATTGAPRLVAFSAEQLCADASHIMQGMHLCPAWANLAAISLAHSYGFSSLVLLLVLQGMPLILAGGGLPEQLRAASSLWPDLVLPSVPALWRTWLEATVIPPNIRVAISAGAPLPLALEQQIFERHGLKVHNFYGSTECGGIAYDPTSEPRQHAQLAGRVMPGVQVSLNPEGCVEVQGPNVGMGYWPEPDPTLAGGVFRTRDLGEMREGLLFLRGRASDQINVAGRKVAPDAIEQVLRNHPEVRECVVFGVPDHAGHRGEAIVAAVVLSAPQVLGAVRQYTQNQLPPWQWPKHWWLTEELSPNERGKISRAQWSARYQAAHKTAAPG